MYENEKLHKFGEIIRRREWINTTYNTINSKNTFTTLGSEQTENVAWSQFATNNSIDTSGGAVIIYQTNSNFSSYSTKYYWSLNLTDGIHWTNVTYSFQ